MDMPPKEKRNTEDSAVKKDLYSLVKAETEQRFIKLEKHVTKENDKTRMMVANLDNTLSKISSSRVHTVIQYFLIAGIILFMTLFLTSC